MAGAGASGDFLLMETGPDGFFRHMLDILKGNLYFHLIQNPFTYGIYTGTPAWK